VIDGEQNEGGGGDVEHRGEGLTKEMPLRLEGLKSGSSEEPRVSILSMVSCIATCDPMK
jgi:hypothetical protein